MGFGVCFHEDVRLGDYGFAESSKAPQVPIKNPNAPLKALNSLKSLQFLESLKSLKSLKSLESRNLAPKPETLNPKP